MTDRMDLLVVAGMIDRKIFSKVLPLIKSDKVNKIYVVRRNFISGEKIRCLSPKGPLRRSILLGELYRLFAIIYILAKYKPEVVIGIGLILHGVYSNILGSVFCKKKILLLMGKNDLALTYPRRRVLQRILLRIAFFSDYVGTRGTRSRNWLVEKRFERDKMFIPHNVFDFDEFAPRPLSVKKYDMIYVGVLKHYKRIELLIDIVYKLVVENGFKDVRLAIVGEGKLRDMLQRRVARLKMDDHIEFLPPGDAAYVCNLLNQSKIFVMTSQGEGLPMAVIEAMSCGLPVAIFDDADIADVVRHGENGLLIQQGDLDGFIEAVKLLLQHNNVYERLSRGALAIRNERRDEYSLEQAKKTWEKALTSCVQ
jgi:glycosyltransferase involved in cell wall biosynthesis